MQRDDIAILHHPFDGNRWGPEYLNVSRGQPFVKRRHQEEGDWIFGTLMSIDFVVCGDGWYPANFYADSLQRCQKSLARVRQAPQSFDGKTWGDDCLTFQSHDLLIEKCAPDDVEREDPDWMWGFSLTSSEEGWIPRNFWAAAKPVFVENFHEGRSEGDSSHLPSTLVHLGHAQNAETHEVVEGRGPQSSHLAEPVDAIRFITTVSVNGLRTTCTREELVEFLNDQGFDALYNFVHLALDFSDCLCLGHALINFVNTKVAKEFIAMNQGSEGVIFESACNAELSSEHNGIDELVERYRNSPVMHHSVSRVFAPLLFCNGVRVPFPEPTQAIKAPRIRNRDIKDRSIVDIGGRADVHWHPESNGSKPNSNTDSHNEKHSADTTSQRKEIVELHRVLNSELEQRASVSQSSWTLVWVSERFFKPCCQNQRKSLEALGCQVKGYKTYQNAVRAFDKKRTLESTVVLVSAGHAKQLTSYLQSRPEMSRTPMIVEDAFKEAGVRENATCSVVGDFDAAVLAVSQVAALHGFA